YLSTVVTPVLERHKQGGAVAEKFEAAYLRTLSFDDVPQSRAEQVYRQRSPDDADYKQLQDFLFRYIARECGRLDMAVHIHTMAGAGGYFDVTGASPHLSQAAPESQMQRRNSFFHRLYAARQFW